VIRDAVKLYRRYGIWNLEFYWLDAAKPSRDELRRVKLSLAELSQAKLSLAEPSCDQLTEYDW